MRCIRIFVFILLFIFTAVGTCSSLFPLFRKEVGSGSTAEDFSVYYWYTESSVTNVDKSQLIVRNYTRNHKCEKFKLFYIVSGALSAGGAGFGGMATLMALAHIYIRPKCCMCFGILFTSFLASACFVVCVAMTTVSYTQDSCNDASKPLELTPKLKDLDYKIVEGFGLMCAAAGGYLVSFLLEICA